MRLLIAALLAAVSLPLTAWAQPTDATCLVDDEIPVGTRSEIESSAISTVNDFIAGRAEAIDAKRSRRLADESLAEQVLPMRIMLAGFGELSDVRASAAYLVAPGSGQAEEIECGGTEAHPGGVAVSVEPAGRLAFVEVVGEGVNNTAGILIVLAEEDGAWAIDYFYFGTARMARVTGEELGVRARAEREGGRSFNATLLYRVAAAMLERGPYMSLNAHAALDRDFETFRPPEALAGVSPQRWQFSGGVETVRLVGLIAIGGKFYVMVHRDAFGPWPTEAAIERENMRFMKEMLARWPEITAAFAGVAVQAAHPDGRRTFTSVWQIGEPLEESGTTES